MNFDAIVRTCVAAIGCICIVAVSLLLIPERHFTREIYSMYWVALAIIFTLFFVGIGMGIQGGKS